MEFNIPKSLSLFLSLTSFIFCPYKKKKNYVYTVQYKNLLHRFYQGKINTSSGSIWAKVLILDVHQDEVSLWGKAELEICKLRRKESYMFCGLAQVFVFFICNCHKICGWNSWRVSQVFMPLAQDPWFNPILETVRTVLSRTAFFRLQETRSYAPSGLYRVSTLEVNEIRS